MRMLLLVATSAPMKARLYTRGGIMLRYCGGRGGIMLRYSTCWDRGGTVSRRHWRGAEDREQVRWASGKGVDN